MNDQYFGTKELYNVVLKATENTKFGARNLEKGEPVTYFDHIQIATLGEHINPVYARGGRGNDPLVIWEDRQQVGFNLTCGVMSDIGFALISNAKVIVKDSGLKLARSEKIELDENGKGTFSKYLPCKDKPVYCFLYDNRLIQKKIAPKAIHYEDGIIEFDEQYHDSTVIVDYYFDYEDTANIYILEKDRFNGLFELEGRFYRKGEEDGINRTTLFRLPKVRINSNLSLQLGELASPSISTFNIIATPQKTQYSSFSVAEFYNLDRDIE